MPSSADLAAQWDARISTIARNLTDFCDSDAARLTRARASSYVGRTREVAMDVETSIKGLQDDYLVLSGVVNDAVRASRKPAFLTNRDAEVRDLLEGPSVRLRTLSVPIHRRGLLDAAQSQDRVSVGEVLASMLRTFERVRDGATAILSAEDAIAGRIASLQARLSALKGWSSATHVDVGIAAIPVTQIDETDRDPLGSAARLDAVELALAKAEAARVEADGQLEVLRARLGAAERALDVLREIYRAHGPAHAALATLAVARPPAAPNRTQELADWLGSIRRFLAKGDLKPVSIGLDRWEAGLSEAKAQAETALAAARAPVVELENLRGLFTALRAKGAALGGVGTDEERAAKAAVRSERIDLAQVRACVKAYETVLAAAGSRKVG